MAQPFLVLVTGPPGSGKTTLAHNLGNLIPCPVISQDEVLQGLRDVGTGAELVVDDIMVKESFHIFFSTVRNLLLGNVSVVAEAAFPVGSCEDELEPLCSLAQARLILCRADASLIAQRIAQRATAEPAGFAAHVAGKLLRVAGEGQRIFHDYGPMDLGIPRFDVETNAGYNPQLVEVLSLFGIHTRLPIAV